MMRVAALVAVGLCLATLPCWAGSVKVLVDGKEMPMSPPAMLRDGRVFIPVTVFRKIGLAVTVKNSREAIVGWPESDDVLLFKAGVSRYSEQYDVKAAVTLPGTPFMSCDVLMVPLSAHLSSKRHQTSLMATWDLRSRTVHVRRARHFLRWRLEYDSELVKAQPDSYSHVWLGEYIPIVPKLEIARAEKLDRSGDWQGAVRILRRLIDARPFTWQPEFYHHRDEWLAYEPLGVILSREYPSQSEGHIYTGIGRAVRKDYSGAQGSFDQGITVDPTNADLLFAAGWAVLRQERAGTVFQKNTETMTEALSYFERALEVNPTHEPSLRAAGYACLAMNSKPYLEKAADYFERLREQTGPNKRLDSLINTILLQISNT